MKNKKIEVLSVAEMQNTKGGSQESAAFHGIGGVTSAPGGGVIVYTPGGTLRITRTGLKLWF